MGSHSDLLSKFYEQMVQQVASVILLKLSLLITRFLSKNVVRVQNHECSRSFQVFFVAVTTYVLAALTMTAAVIVGSKASASLANLIDSVACPASVSSSANANPASDLLPATGTNDTSIETIGVDLDALTIGQATSCENSKRVFGTPTGSGWCDGSSAFIQGGVGKGRRHGDPGVPRFEDNGMLLKFGSWEFNGNWEMATFSTQLDAVPPLLAGLERKEIPQSTTTRVFLS